MFRGMMKKSLTIPLDFVPYMEKYKLYDFFYELVTQLLIQRPDDPIVFMKQCVQHAIRKRDIPRVILIAPPNFDKMTLATILQDETGICPVTLNDLNDFTNNTCYCYDANEIAIRMKKILLTGVLHDSGWTLVDIPRNKMEARALQRVGVIPTHVIQIITPNEDDNRRSTTSDSLSGKSSLSTEDMMQHDYKKTLRGLREAYSNLLIEVQTGTRTIQELGKDCAALTKIPKHYGAPSLFRVVLIGPPGSGHHSLAKNISETFHLNYINFNYILAQVCMQDAALCEMLRLHQQRCGHLRQLSSKLRIEIVKQFLLRPECLKLGWILTGYPKTVEDFKLLDMIPTPPNRVIILKIDDETCREGLCCQQNTEMNNENVTSCETFRIDADYKLNFSMNYENIEQSLQEYKENIELILQYAGDTASVIDATDERRLVKERLEGCLMRPIPSSKIRIPAPPPPIDPMDIEFEPDDEPDPSTFDDVRAPEPTYSFI